jgi:hypothetical protein
MNLWLIFLLLVVTVLAAKRKPPTTTFSPASQPFVIEADRYYELSEQNYAKAKHAKNARVKNAEIARAQADREIAQSIMTRGSTNGSYGSE